MKPTLAKALVALTFAMCAGTVAAHDLIIEEGSECRSDNDCRKWQVVTAVANIRAGDMGLRGAIFVGAASNGGQMLAFTPAGWEPFKGGIEEPSLEIASFSGTYRIVVFDSRPVGGYLGYRGVGSDWGRLPVTNNGLTGETMCDAARALGADRFAIAVGYGVVTPEAEATVSRSKSVGGHADPDMIRLAYVHNDMLTNTKWQSVKTFDCYSYEGS